MEQKDGESYCWMYAANLEPKSTLKTNFTSFFELMLRYPESTKSISTALQGEILAIISVSIFLIYILMWI